MVLAAQQSTAKDRLSYLRDLEKSAEILKGARPTAVNLAWAVDRQLRVGTDEELESVEVSWEEEKIGTGKIDMKHEMKMRNFVQDTDGWRRKFIYITIEEGQMKMGTLISSKNNKLSDIEFEDIDEWIKYFDRI